MPLAQGFSYVVQQNREASEVPAALPRRGAPKETGTCPCIRPSVFRVRARRKENGYPRYRRGTCRAAPCTSRPRTQECRPTKAQPVHLFERFVRTAALRIFTKDAPRLDGRPQTLVQRLWKGAHYEILRPPVRLGVKTVGMFEGEHHCKGFSLRKRSSRQPTPIAAGGQNPRLFAFSSPEENAFLKLRAPRQYDVGGFPHDARRDNTSS